MNSIRKRDLVLCDETHRVGRVRRLLGRGASTACVKWEGVVVPGRFYRRSMIAVSALRKITRQEFSAATAKVFKPGKRGK